MERNTNPWIVKNLKEFQFFHCSDCEFKNLDHTELLKHCLDYRGHIINDFLLYTCPECDYKSVSKMEFIKHAVNNHEKSESLIESFHIIQDVEIIPSNTNPINEHSSSNSTEKEVVQDNVITLDVEIIPSNTNPTNSPSISTGKEVTNARKVKCYSCKKTFEKSFKMLPTNFKGPLLTLCAQCCNAKRGKENEETSNKTLQSVTPQVKRTTSGMNTTKTSPQEVPKEEQQSPHKCDACRSIFKSESDLTIHILGFHRRLVRQLPCCAELLGNEFVCHYIQSHSNVSRVEKVRILKQFNLIPCLKCNDLFSRKEDLEQHELKVHSVIEAPKPKFSKEVRVSLPKLSKSEISKHTQRTIKESTYNSTNSESSKIYKCEICELCLSSDKLLKMHKAMVHPKYGITAKTKNKHRNGNFLNRKGRKLIPSFSEVKSIYDQG